MRKASIHEIHACPKRKKQEKLFHDHDIDDICYFTCPLLYKLRKISVPYFPKFPSQNSHPIPSLHGPASIPKKNEQKQKKQKTKERDSAREIYIQETLVPSHKSHLPDDDIFFLYSRKKNAKLQRLRGGGICISQ